MAGRKHTKEARQKMSEARRGRKYSEEHKAAIGAANRGKVRAKIHARVCACGVEFTTGAANAAFCSLLCRRASYGHGLRHAPKFAHFPKHCAICNSVNQLVGDHDHATGAARGILCRNCNLALGNMMDDPARLRAAAEYLEKTKP